MSKWLSWQPAAQITGKTPEGEPTKTTKIIFDVFDGCSQGDFPIIPPPVSPEEMHATLAEAAIGLLNLRGVRIMEMGGGFTLGVWRELDGPELREAIKFLGMDALPVRYLNEPDIPERYRQHKPAHLKPEVERTEAEQRAISWAEWRTELLNRSLFQDQGATGQQARIMANTVRHGDQQRLDETAKRDKPDQDADWNSSTET